MKLRVKLPLAFLAASLLVMCAALWGMYQLNQALKTYETTVQAYNANERTVAGLLNQFKVQVQEWKNVLLRGKNPQQLERYWGAFQKVERAITEQTRQLRAELSPDEADARRLIEQFSQAHAAMGQAYRKGFEAFKASGFDPAVGDAAVQGIDREAATLLDEAGNKIEAASKAVAGRSAIASQRASLVSLVLMLVVCAVSLAGSLVFSRNVVAALQQAVQVSRAVADGDLTSANPVHSTDEIAELLNALHAMQSNLVRVVSHMRASAAGVADASAEIAAGGTDLSTRTEQTSASLQEASASMEELGASVHVNADHANQARQLAVNASGVAVQGGSIMGRVIDTMQGISEASTRIADIIGVIDGIAFQTNILALNAAVEAARAGEQGRGFAVVASEVRSLALRSADAAKEIKTLVGTSSERVQLGSGLVQQAGSTMQEVVESIQRLTDIVSAISEANQEQSAGVTEVANAVAQIDKTTQKNAALVEESAAAADSLRMRAQEMVQEVSVFRLQNHPAAGISRTAVKTRQQQQTPAVRLIAAA